MTCMPCCIGWFSLSPPTPAPQPSSPASVHGLLPLLPSIPHFSDVLERPCPCPLLLPFQSLRLTAKILLQRLRCQEDLSLKIFGPPSAGTIGGPSEEGGSQPEPPPPTPLQTPPTPLLLSVGPNFSHHKARVQAVGWFPLGTRKQGSRPFAAPTPPNRNGAGPKAGPAHPPPPRMPSHPRTHCRPSHGDQGPSPHGQGADAERRVCWDLGPAW